MIVCDYFFTYLQRTDSECEKIPGLIYYRLNRLIVATDHGIKMAIEHQLENGMCIMIKEFLHAASFKNVATRFVVNEAQFPVYPVDSVYGE